MNARLLQPLYTTARQWRENIQSSRYEGVARGLDPMKYYVDDICCASDSSMLAAILTAPELPRNGVKPTSC